MMIIDYVYDEFARLDNLAEPGTKNFLICKSAWFMFGIIAIYLHIIYISGPAFMKKRKPYNLKNVLILYNIVQIVCNLYLFYLILDICIWKYKFVCQPIDYSNSPDVKKVLNCIWYYFVLKVFDLLDTIFFILRKKRDQVTLLHVYHHSGMIILVWMGFKFTPGGHALYLGLINTFIHVIMYSYYFLTTYIGKMWWKKYVTQLQIIQFVLLLLQHVLALLQKDCNFSKMSIILFIPHNFFVLVLFVKFYINTYIRKKKSLQNEASNKTDNNSIKLSKEKSKLVRKVE